MRRLSQYGARRYRGQGSRCPMMKSPPIFSPRGDSVIDGKFAPVVNFEIYDRMRRMCNRREIRPLHKLSKFIKGANFSSITHSLPLIWYFLLFAPGGFTMTGDFLMILKDYLIYYKSSSEILYFNHSST